MVVKAPKITGKRIYSKNWSDKVGVISACGRQTRTTFFSNLPRVNHRAFARISEMPVQNNNFKISARPDLATYLIQILIPATLNSLLCQKGQITLQLCPRRWFLRKIFVYYPPKVKLNNLHRNFCLSNYKWWSLWTLVHITNSKKYKYQVIDIATGYSQCC